MPNSIFGSLSASSAAIQTQIAFFDNRTGGAPSCFINTMIQTPMMNSVECERYGVDEGEVAAEGMSAANITFLLFLVLLLVVMAIVVLRGLAHCLLDLANKRQSLKSAAKSRTTAAMVERRPGGQEHVFDERGMEGRLAAPSPRLEHPQAASAQRGHRV